MRVLFFIVGLFLFTGNAFAQTSLLPEVWINNSLVKKNSSVNLKQKKQDELPIAIKAVQPMRAILFYWVMALLLLMAIIKVVYSKYMENLLKVILNSTLRQSQLMEQLIQASRPSFYLNLLFILSFTTLITLIAGAIVKKQPDLQLFITCIFLVSFIYLFKSIIVRLLGWVSGFRKEVKEYMFILWLMNKGIGIVCLPWILFLAFSEFTNPVITIYAPLICIAILIAVRYFRTYARIQYDISMKPFHILIYLLSVEVMPALLIFKGFTDFIIKKQ